jgi:hydroxymethylpyrimidine pyrophosphatase-like HAD family hydrolase
MSSTLDGDHKKNNKEIHAILSDYDGTLCSASAARDNSLGQNRIPPEIKEVLQQISQQIPLCIISSKDYFFLKETRSFARVISCLMGIETLSFATNEEQSPFRSNLLLDDSKLSAHSDALEGIAKNIESEPEFSSILVERKYTFDRRILAGITVDWRQSNDWDYYKKGVQHLVSSAVTNLYRLPEPVNLYLQKYDFHPFIDVYATQCSKETGFGLVLSEISIRNSGEKNDSIRAEDVLYLGDSENDNPAFRKAGISIGVRSDSRLKPELDCQYYIDFGDMVTFLNKLKNNNFVFTRNLLQ